MKCYVVETQGRDQPYAVWHSALEGEEILYFTDSKLKIADFIKAHDATHRYSGDHKKR